jgi:integrase
MLDVRCTILPDAERGGRASGKETMARPRYQNGSVVVRGKRNKVRVLRWREDVRGPDGSVRTIHRAETLGPVSKIPVGKARETLQSRISTANQKRRRPQASITLSDFVGRVWKPNAELGLKRSSVRYYSFQLEKHILPGLGLIAVYDLDRAQIESCLSEVKRKGYASATLRGVRATLSAVLQTAVEQQYLEENPAHGIRLRETDTKRERRFYSPQEVRHLLRELDEPCRMIVLVAVLTGMRIGEILALRWKRVDLLRGTIEVAETFSEGEFGPPKTRSSFRVIPMSSSLSAAIQVHRSKALRKLPDDLVFSTAKGTPLSPKNLYNRELAPACDRTNQPRVSWHSFRHTHATLLVDSGESIKTAQALLGHADLETTLNTYAHAIPSSQRQAVERVAGVLFSDVLNSALEAKGGAEVN